MSESQVHSSIKMFSGPLTDSGLLSPELSEKVSKYFVDNPGLSAKSVGVEFLESRSLALVSVGFAPGAGRPVRLSCAEISKVGDGGEADLDRISAEMSAAAEKVGSVVCHEFYVTADGTLFAVFLANQLV